MKYCCTVNQGVPDGQCPYHLSYGARMGLRSCCSKTCGVCAVTRVPTARPTQFPTRQFAVPSTSELLKQCGMAARVTVEATLSAVASRLHNLNGELALHLTAGESLTLEADLVVRSDTAFFLDGRRSGALGRGGGGGGTEAN